MHDAVPVMQCSAQPPACTGCQCSQGYNQLALLTVHMQLFCLTVPDVVWPLFCVADVHTSLYVELSPVFIPTNCRLVSRLGDSVGGSLLLLSHYSRTCFRKADDAMAESHMLHSICMQSLWPIARWAVGLLRCG
jgi:hypothetical protein